MLLRAVAGSRLYGTHRPDSDFDFYEVHDRIRNKQTIRDGVDTIRVNLSDWIRYAEKGTHQALDAMWCPPEYTEVDVLREFRLSFRPDPFRASNQLYATAKAMDDTKPKHSNRLYWCAQRVLDFGWYDPTEWGVVQHG